MSETLTHQLQHKINQLNPEQQMKVLEFVREFDSSSIKGTSGRELLRFAGSISRDDIDIIASEIETGCERVNPNEW